MLTNSAMYMHSVQNKMKTDTLYVAMVVFKSVLHSQNQCFDYHSSMKRDYNLPLYGNGIPAGAASYCKAVKSICPGGVCGFKTNITIFVTYIYVLTYEHCHLCLLFVYTVTQCLAHSYIHFLFPYIKAYLLLAAKGVVVRDHTVQYSGFHTEFFDGGREETFWNSKIDMKHLPQ